MNKPSEQLTADKSLHTAKDQPLTSKEIFNCLEIVLGADNCVRERIEGRTVIKYTFGEKTFILLAKAVTYLGNPHPIFKKRIQLPDWYQDFALQHTDYDIRFLGVYHYEGNIVFVDFQKETYLQHGLHNSSAHVYVNDLYQGMTFGKFEKQDRLGNNLVVIRYDKLKDYLDGKIVISDNLFELFKRFNCGYPFGKWLYALDVIKEMHENSWKQWRQAEWAGWFLEYKFNQFAVENHTERQMRYIGSENKGKNAFDFDIKFEEDDFYGDLKASDISKRETPGNDQKTLMDCIYRYDKFWYVIYEHKTIKDSESTDYEATKSRNRYIKEVDSSYQKDEMSYHERMKHSVNFVKMSIVELNRINYGRILTAFNQGHQPDGSMRNPKFNINKKVLDNDNYVVFRYEYNEEV